MKLLLTIVVQVQIPIHLHQILRKFVLNFSDVGSLFQMWKGIIRLRSMVAWWSLCDMQKTFQQSLRRLN